MFFPRPGRSWGGLTSAIVVSGPQPLWRPTIQRLRSRPFESSLRSSLPHQHAAEILRPNSTGQNSFRFFESRRPMFPRPARDPCSPSFPLLGGIVDGWISLQHPGFILSSFEAHHSLLPPFKTSRELGGVLGIAR